MQLEETVSKGESNVKFIFFPQHGKAREEERLVVGGLLGLFALCFSRSPSLWEDNVLFLLSIDPKVRKFKIWLNLI